MNPVDYSDTEAMLRTQLGRLADLAPQVVVAPDEVYVPHGVASREPRRRWVRIGVPVVAGLIGTGITAVAATGQNDAGAASPVEAVQMFVAAIEREDALGIIDILVPEEAQALKSSLDDLQAEATKAGVVNEGLSMSGIAGLDIRTSDMTYEAEDLGEGLATVRIATGMYSATFDPATFPFGDQLRSAIQPDGVAIDPDNDLSNSRLTTIRRDGRWFVSPSYTVAEAARRGSAFNVPASRADEAVGFESPEAAAAEFYQRLAAVDVAGMAAMAAPGEGDALARYLPLWLPQIDEAVASGKASGLAFALSDLTMDTIGQGRFRTLVPATFHVEATLPATAYQSYEAAFDPALPTYLSDERGNSYLVPAGEPIPATIEGLERTTEFPDGPLNFLSVAPDGTIARPPVPIADDAPPLTLTIDHRDGCSAVSGTIVPRMVDIGWQPITPDGNGVVRVCDSSIYGGTGGLLFGALIGNGLVLTQLPVLTVVEVGGKWYVSPLGTLAASITQLIRGSDDPLGIDSSFAILLFGTDRANLDAELSRHVPAECESLVDRTGDVAKLAESPAANLIRTCWAAVQEWLSGGGASSGFPTAAGGDVVVTEEIPATIAPPAADPVEPPASEPAVPATGA